MTADRRDPDFDLRTAVPDPRWLVSDPIPYIDDRDMFFAKARVTALALRENLKHQYPYETMDMFALMVEQEAGLRVVVGFGFSHNPLENAPAESDNA